MTLYASTSLLRLRLRLQLVLLLYFYVLLIPDNKQQQCNIFLCSNSVQCVCMCVCLPYKYILPTCIALNYMRSHQFVRFGSFSSVWCGREIYFNIAAQFILIGIILFVFMFIHYAD